MADATLMPEPVGSWSSDLLSVPNAVLAPPFGKRSLTFPAGVLDGDGRFVHQSSVWRGKRRIMLPVADAPKPQAHLAGRWLWGGLLYNHFGHFLCEGTTRLWGVHAAKQPLEGVLFFAKWDDEEGSPLPGYQQEFLRLMGIDLPAHIIRVPCTVEELIVPGQGFGLGPMASGTAQFQQVVRTQFAKDVTPKGGDKLYISRSAIGPRKGGLLFETRLEALLEAEGYEIYHPQKHSLEDQAARYKAATHILAAEGSALHFLAFVARDDQKVGMVVRRVSGATRNLMAHVHGFSGTRPTVVEAIKRSWMPRDGGRMHMAMAELDFPVLQAKLHAAGFVSSAQGWPAISEQEAEAEIYSVRFRRVHNYVPVQEQA